MSSAVLILGAGHLPDRQLGPAPLLHDHPLDLPAGSDLAIQRLINHFRFHAPDRALVAVIDRGSHWHHHCLADQLDQILIGEFSNISGTFDQLIVKVQKSKPVGEQITRSGVAALNVGRLANNESLRKPPLRVQHVRPR